MLTAGESSTSLSAGVPPAAGTVEPTAASEVASKPVTCALIADKALAFDQSPTFALLEADLSRHPRLALVERTQLARIIEEETLQRALGAEGGDARRQLGGLLKAQMVMILRAAEKKLGDPQQPQQQQTVRSLRVMIADTGNGLRVLTTDHVWDDKQPQPAVESIREDVDRALAKLAAALRAVVAVPPFVCEDFTFGYSLLKGAYAEMLIQTLDGVPGVQTVEIAEARAVAAERGLAGDDALRRPLLPYFLLGAYRNEGEGDGRRVRVSVRLERDGKPLSEPSTATLAPNGVGAHLQDIGRAFVKQMLQVEPPPFDAAREVEQIVRRTRELERLGDYEQAFRLIEVAALIQPGPPVYERAVRLAAGLADQLHNPYLPEDFLTRSRKALDACFSAVDDLKRLAGVPDFDLLQSRGLIERGCACGDNVFQLMGMSGRPELRKGMNDLGEVRRQFIVSQIERLDAEAKLTTTTVWRWASLITRAEYPLPRPPVVFGAQEPSAPHYDDTYRLISVLYKYRFPGLTTWWCHTLLKLKVSDSPEFHDLLDRVAGLPGRRSKVIAAYFRLLATTKDSAERARELAPLIAYARDSGIAAEDRWLLSYLQEEMPATARSKGPELAAKPPATSPSRSTGSAPAASRLRFIQVPQFGQAFEDYLARIDPLYADSKKQYPEKNFTYGLVSALRGCIQSRDGSDIYWTGDYAKGGQIFAMRRAGRADALYESDGGRLYSVIYDGRYLWANEAGRDGRTNRLVVVDPDSGQAERITAADGLLPGEMVIAPVIPGCICAIGYFGRTWCALVRYEGPGRRSVEVFHEAALAQGDALDSRVAFQPAIAATLPESAASTRPYVLVLKQPQPTVKSASYNPLLIDPVAKTLKVLPFPVLLQPGLVAHATHKGVFYWLEPIGQADLQLWQLAGPDWQKQRITEKVRNSVTGLVPPHLAFLGDRCLLLGPKVWHVDLETGRLAPVEYDEYRKKFPDLFRESFVPTHHSGLVVLPTYGELYRAEFELATSRPVPATGPSLSQLADARPPDRERPTTRSLDLAAGTKPAGQPTSAVSIPPRVAAEVAGTGRHVKRESPGPSARSAAPPLPQRSGGPPPLATSFSMMGTITRSTEYGPRPVVFETVGETVCEGRILDNETGRPIPDALVFPSPMPPPLNALCFTEEQWAKFRALSLDDLRKIGSATSDPELQSLASLRAYLSFPLVGRTDSQGHYRISVKTQDAPSQLVVIAKLYLPLRSGIADTGPPNDGIKTMPDVRLGRSAIVAFRPVAAQRLKLQLYLVGDRGGFLSHGPTYRYMQTPPPGMPKVPTPPIPFPRMAPRPYAEGREGGRAVATEPSPIWTNEDCRFPVPAGMEITIELRGHQAGAASARAVRPAVVAQKVTLRPGEVLDAGEVKIEYTEE